jgi:hypothetical protein
MSYPRKFSRRGEDDSASWLGWTAALVALYLVLVLPNRLGDFQAQTFLRLPLELPALILLLMLTPAPLRLAVRIVAVAALAPLLIVKLADMVVFFVFARPFSPLVDLLMVPIALDTLGKNSLWLAAGAVAGVALLIAVVIVLLWRAVRTLQRRAVRWPIAAGAAVALLVAIFTPIGNGDASRVVRDQGTAVAASLRAAAAFRVELADDPFRDVPPGQALAGLKGTDVLLIFVEAYGRSALDNPDYAPVVAARLKRFDEALAGAGFSARSAWLTSPTYGGESYLAHSTFVSGLWINEQQRYAQLLRSQRRTLIHEFRDAGWRTVAFMPVITSLWPEGDYFGYDKIYDAPALEYAGQPFGYMTMPDQYTLSVLQTRELAAEDRKPVMAEVALISSHIPWVPVPKLVPWGAVGDGKIFNTARTTEDADDIWRDPKRLRQYYAMSLDYVLETLMSFVVTYGRDDMLLIVLGDHQPMGFMADSEARDVPIHIISRDPARLDALGGDWTAGMTPDASSPIQPMDALRGRILRAFTPDGTVQTPPAQ